MSPWPNSTGWVYLIMSSWFKQNCHKCYPISDKLFTGTILVCIFIVIFIILVVLALALHFELAEEGNSSESYRTEGTTMKADKTQGENGFTFDGGTGDFFWKWDKDHFQNTIKNSSFHRQY